MRLSRFARRGEVQQESTIAVERHDLRVAVVAAVIGAAAGWAVTKLATEITNVTLWLFVATSIVAFMTCLVTLGVFRSFSRYSGEKYDAMLDIAASINTSVTHQAHLIPRDEIYPEMAKSLRNAKFQVAVMTLFMYDWEEERRTFGPADEETPGRDDFYDAVYDSISDKHVEYIRVWQVPEDRLDNASAAICGDPVHKREMDLISEISKNHPDQARCVIAKEHTTASFILVDRQTLFMNIDFYEPTENFWLSPYMLLIKDARGDTFEDLKSIIVRLTSR